MLNNVPTVGQSLAQTRDPIAANFSTIDTAFAVNHVPYNVSGPSLQGLHQFVQMPTGTPVIATAASQVALYSKVGPKNGIPELFFQRDSLAADQGYAITEGTNTNNGWSRLPSGIILQWGSFTAGTSPRTVTFPTAFITQAFVVVATPLGAATKFFGTGALTTANFQVISSTGDVIAGQFIAMGI